MSYQCIWSHLMNHGGISKSDGLKVHFARNESMVRVEHRIWDLEKTPCVLLVLPPARLRAESRPAEPLVWASRANISAQGSGGFGSDGLAAQSRSSRSSHGNIWLCCFEKISSVCNVFETLRLHKYPWLKKQVCRSIIMYSYSDI